MSSATDRKTQLLLMAEDELTEYSTQARKIEKLRRKVGLLVPYPQQKQLRDELAGELPQGQLGKIVTERRQTVALPFWGIGGLGLLFGISAQQPLDFLATALGFGAAIAIQRWGWKLSARQLAIETLDDIETRVRAEREKTNS